MLLACLLYIIEFRKAMKKKLKPAAAGWKRTRLQCYQSLTLSDDALNDWNTSSICNQLVKSTHNSSLIGYWVQAAVARREAYRWVGQAIKHRSSRWMIKHAEGCSGQSANNQLYKWALYKWKLTNASKQRCDKGRHTNLPIGEPSSTQRQKAKKRKSFLHMMFLNGNKAWFIGCLKGISIFRFIKCHSIVVLTLW